MSTLELTEEQLRLLLQSLVTEEKRCDEGFGLLTRLGLSYTSRAWIKLTQRSSAVRVLQSVVGEKLR